MILYNPKVSGSIVVKGAITSTVSTLVSSSAQVNLTGTTGYSTFSSSLASNIAQNVSDISQNASDITALQTDSGSISTRLSNAEATLSGLDGSYATDAELAAVSGALASQVATNVSDISTNSTDIGVLTSFSGSVANGLSFSGSDVTVKGNLTVSGTTTTVNSTTVELGDNIIELNGTSAALGGIHVNDTPAKGALLWDGDANQWIAGASGSEEKVLLAKSHNIVSGSAQVDITATTGYTAFSSSLADASRVFTATISGSTLFNITHNLNTEYPIVQVYNAAKVQVLPETVATLNASSTQITFGTSFEGVAVFKK